MAKKAKEKKSMQVVKAAPADDRITIVQVKGTAEFREWLNDLAETDRSTVVQIVEKGIIMYAKSVGYDKPAPKRAKGR